MSQPQPPHSNNEPVRIKQRVIGAVVLISLGIIFIPMILNSERALDDGMPVFGSNIPNKPNYISKQSDKVATPPSAAIIIKSQADFDSRIIVDEHTPKKKDDSVASFAKVDKAKNETKATTKPKEKTKAKEKTKTVKKKTTAKKIITAKKIPSAKKSAKAWAIQVGSFSERKNAFSLRNKLRKKQFVAFVESINTAKGHIYRVRVGPELKHAQAVKTQKRLIKELKISGLVIAHP